MSAMHRHEPAERADGHVNAMLDLAEQAIRTVVDAGAEAPLRARLARLIPAVAQTADGPAGAATPASVSPRPEILAPAATAAPTADCRLPTAAPLDRMALASILTALRTSADRRLTSADHTALARARALVTKAMEVTR